MGRKRSARDEIRRLVQEAEDRAQEIRGQFSRNEIRAAVADVQAEAGAGGGGGALIILLIIILLLFGGRIDQS